MAEAPSFRRTAVVAFVARGACPSPRRNPHGGRRAATMAASNGGSLDGRSPALDPRRDDPRLEHGVHRRHASSTSRCRRCSASCRRDVADVQWVVEAYALLLAALLLVGGSLGDRFGRRRVFAHRRRALRRGVDLAAGWRRSVAQLIAARAVQGVGGALLVPGSLAHHQRVVSARASAAARSAPGRASPRSRRRSARCSAAGWSSTARGAGLLHQPAARRSSCCVIAVRRVPESRDDAAPSASTGAARAARHARRSAAIVYALIEASARGWRRASVLVALRRASLAWPCFVVVERRAARRRCCRSRCSARATFTGANLLTLAALRRARRRAVLPAAQPDPGAGLLGDRGRRGAAAVHR